MHICYAHTKIQLNPISNFFDICKRNFQNPRDSKTHPRVSRMGNNRGQSSAKAVDTSFLLWLSFSVRMSPSATSSPINSMKTANCSLSSTLILYEYALVYLQDLGNIIITNTQPTYQHQLEYRNQRMAISLMQFLIHNKLEIKHKRFNMQNHFIVLRNSTLWKQGQCYVKDTSIQCRVQIYCNSYQSFHVQLKYLSNPSLWQTVWDLWVPMI